MTLKYTNCRTKLFIIFLLFFVQLFASVSTLDTSKNSFSEQTVSTPIPSISEIESIANTEFPQPLLKLQSFQTPSILFLVDDDSSPDSSLDVPFYDFMSNNLSFNVIYYTANSTNQPYNYTSFDAIVISKSVAEVDTVESLENATIPILTMEAGHYDEFSLGTNYGKISNLDSLTIISTLHYITDEEIAGDIVIYDSDQVINYLKGYGLDFPVGCDIQQLAHHASASALKYASLVALEKDGLRFDLNKSAERRTFWGASNTGNFLPETWSLWNKTLHWTLYDDYSGNATINVHVQDLDSKDITNADVELIDSNNISISWFEKTSQSGIATFTNISSGEYDIKVTFRSLENDSLSNLLIAPTRTYMRTSSFEYSVIMNNYVDITAPEIDNVYFDNATSTFHAHVTDDSSLKDVFLNLTSHNLSTGLEEIHPTNFTMIWDTGNNYFNATSLVSLPGTLVNITYNIIAEDIAGNSYATNLITFDLDDPIAPNIWSYDSQDYGNGTIVFTANITDENGIQAPVILEMNDTYYDMYQEESNLWVFRGMFDYNVFLNYTIYSASDTIGNENGSFVNPGLFPYKNITTSDTTPPRISALSDNFALHEEGHVEFTVQIDDWSTYQSGVNSSQILIILEINGTKTTFNMTAIGEITFVFDYIFNFNDNVTYWINASDNANNFILSTQQGPYRIDDNTIPSVSFSALEYGNGTIDFFAQVLDWPNNDTSAKIFFTNDYFAVDWTNETMIKLNSTTFKFTSLNFPYQTQAIWYYANALDSESNLYDTQIDSALSLQLTDLIAPVINLAYLNSSTIDGEITIIAQATDPYGLIFILNNSINLNISSILGNVSTPMTFDTGTIYIFTTSYVDQTELNITAYVSDLNGNTGFSCISLLVADKAPPTILQYGIESLKNGTLTIYAEIVEGVNGSGLLSDNSSIALVYVFKTQYTETMEWNGTGNFYSFSILNLYSNDAVFYRFKVTDKSNNIILTDWEQYFIGDTVAPVVLDFNITETQIDKTSTEILFWTISSDTFGEIRHVILNYSILAPEGWLNYSVNMNQVHTNYFEKELIVAPKSTIRYQIIVIDTFNNTAVTTYNMIIISDFIPPQLEENGKDIVESIIAAVIVTSFAFLVVMLSVVKLRRRRTRKVDSKKSFAEKLNFLSDVYTILVSSSAGVPIWSITNVLYKSDESMNGNLSGLSVGIDSFLESFQSDFLTQVHGSESASSSQIEGNIKLSVIEQNKVQILIIGSISYRIFVFLKEIPSTFIRETFLKIIKDMEQNIPLVDLGIVDEDLQGPLVKAIICKNLPVGLLEPFKIDLDKLSDFDERMKSEKAISGMTRDGVNVLKILSISHLVQTSSKKQNKQSLLKLFKQTHLSNSQLYSGTLLYKDALNLLKNVVEFTPEDLYEAFWIGINEKVKILIPVSSI